MARLQTDRDKIIPWALMHISNVSHCNFPPFAGDNIPVLSLWHKQTLRSITRPGLFVNPECQNFILRSGISTAYVSPNIRFLSPFSLRLMVVLVAASSVSRLSRSLSVLRLSLVLVPRATCVSKLSGNPQPAPTD